MVSSKPSTEQLVDLTEGIKRILPYYTASGGFSDIWRCTLQTGADQLEIVVAVKVIKVWVDEKELRRELGTWKRLDHVNILPLLGIARDFGPHISMVSRWLENGSLAFYLGEHKDITLFDRLRLLEDIVSGLRHLHGVSAVHGDLNPNNVLVDDEKRALLTDFGLSSMLVDQGYSFSQRSHAKVGTIRYAAPELLNDGAPIKPNTSSDIYSFGCIALQVLSGREPWASVKHEIAVFRRVISGERLQKPVEISHPHWCLIERCLSLLGASLPRPPIDEILEFLKEELWSEGKKSSRSTVHSDGDEPTASFEDNVTVTRQTTDYLAMSVVDMEQHHISPSYNLPSGICDKGKDFAMGSERKRRFFPDFRRRSVQLDSNKIDTQGAGSRQVTRNLIIAADTLKVMQDFAVPPGGLGRTFQCVLRVNSSKKKVAVKSIQVQNNNQADIQEAQNTILEEVKRWMSLQHQNILPVYGTTIGFGSLLPCLVLPWMENGSLTDYLNTMNQEPSIEKLMILSGVAAGLQYLHHEKIIHGNLSGNNVLIDHARTIRLADYGLSSIISAYGDLFQCSRALRWTAPELISDDENLVSSDCSDIYSFGCIMFHVLSGKLPYWWLDDVLCVINARHEGQDPLGSGAEMDERYDEFVRNCLSTSPKDRPTIDEIRSFIARSKTN